MSDLLIPIYEFAIFVSAHAIILVGLVGVLAILSVAFDRAAGIIWERTIRK